MKMSAEQFAAVCNDNVDFDMPTSVQIDAHMGRCSPRVGANQPAYGLELEAFLITPKGAPTLTGDLISRHGGWFTKRDASLHRGGGYEFSSECLALPCMRESITHLVNTIRPYSVINPSSMLLNNNRQYGLHCHVDFTAGSFLLSRFNSSSEAAFTAVAGVAACVADVYKYIAGRGFNRWCYLATTPALIEATYVCQHKYRAVAMRGSTIEFRAGQGRADADHITAYLEFVDALVHFTVEIFSTTRPRDWRDILRTSESMDEVRGDFVQYIAENRRMYPALVARLLKRRSKQGMQDRRAILHVDQLELDLVV